VGGDDYGKQDRRSGAIEPKISWPQLTCPKNNKTDEFDKNYELVTTILEPIRICIHICTGTLVANESNE